MRFTNFVRGQDSVEPLQEHLADDQEEQPDLKIEDKDADDESDEDECEIRVDKKKLLMDLGKVNLIFHC
jgi:hypothetical protein